MKPARVVTVRQPWAWAIASGLKDVENRRRRISSGLLAIHAGRSHDPAGDTMLAQLGIEVPRSLDYGAVVAVAAVVDCVSDSSSPWASPGCWHWLIGSVVALDRPIPLRGMAGIFRAPTPVTELLADAARELHEPVANHHLRA